MVKLQQTILLNREAQSSNTAMFRKDLPMAGAYSGLDVGIRITNGATSARDMDVLDIIKRVSLVMNGTDYRVHIKGQDLFRHYWMKHGRPMPYTWNETGGAVQEVWFRLAFGRFLGDTQLGLDLSRFNNAQVQIDYDCTVWGAVAATTFATGTFAVTLIAHEFPPNQRPAFRSMITLREFWNGTSAASGDYVQVLPSSDPVLAVSVSCLEDGVAEATDITDIKIGEDTNKGKYIDGKWYNYQQIQNADLDVREELFNLYASDAVTRDIHLANIKQANAKCKVVTTAVA